MIITIKCKEGSYSFDEADEEWAPVKDCPEHYEISNMGRCRSLPRYTKWGSQTILIKGRLLRMRHRIGKYSSYLFSVFNEHITMQIHTLVASHFIPNPQQKETVNHKFGLKWDNRASQLEWATFSENTLHALDTRLNKVRKLTANDVKIIRASNLSDIQLAAQFNVRQGNIWNIRNNKTWRHVKND